MVASVFLQKTQINSDGIYDLAVLKVGRVRVK